MTLDELAKITEWKMARGTWRQRNLVLVQSNSPELVEETSREALSNTPDAKKPISILSRLSGVGPATASAVVAATAPEIYPFFDDLVAEQIEGLGKIGFTSSFYNRYSEAIRDRAGRLGAGWTPGDGRAGPLGEGRRQGRTGKLNDNGQYATTTCRRKGSSTLKGKICLVTGANSGIGKFTAIGLANLGATVVMVCRDNERGRAARKK